MNRRTLLIAAGLAALGLITALFVLGGDDVNGFTFAVVAVLLAADLVGVYFIMQYGLQHDGLPHVGSVEETESIQKLRRMNAERLAKVEAGRARAALTAGSTAEATTDGAPAAPKRQSSRRRAAPAAEGEAAAE